MKQPMFLYKGKQYPVGSISFYEGELSLLTFTKGNQFVTAFQKSFSWESEEIRSGMVHANLSECLRLQEGDE